MQLTRPQQLFSEPVLQSLLLARLDGLFPSYLVPNMYSDSGKSVNVTVVTLQMFPRNT